MHFIALKHKRLAPPLVKSKHTLVTGDWITNRKFPSYYWLFFHMAHNPVACESIRLFSALVSSFTRPAENNFSEGERRSDDRKYVCRSQANNPGGNPQRKVRDRCLSSRWLGRNSVPLEVFRRKTIMPCLPTRVKGCTLRNIWYLYEKRNKQTNK